MICIRCHRESPIEAPFCPWCGAAQQQKQAAKQRGNGQGTAYKRGKTWTARICIGWRTDQATGKLKPVHRCSGGHKTKKAALEAITNLKAGISDHTVPNLQHYWQLYEASDLPTLGKSKQQAYTIAWRKLSPLHYKKMDVITVSDLRTVAEAAADTYYTRRDIKTLLSHLFRLAAADGFAQKDLPEFIQLPSLEEKERDPFSETEQAAMWRAYESGIKDIRMPLLMIYTGMMPGELLALRTEMVDLEQKIITGAGMKTKVRKQSAIYVPDCLLPILEELCAESKRGKLFEINKDNLYKRYYAALEAAGVRKLSPYSCRHTTATALAITENIAPQTIKKIMRWSTTRMLDRYAHASSKDASDAINTLK